jgi:F-type H+-transporting ATPase subunit a
MKRTLPVNFALKSFAAFLILFGLVSGNTKANEPGGHAPAHTDAAGHAAKNPDEDISKIIIHHLMDSHDWHITDIGETPIALHLPWILYNSELGLQFYGGTHALEEDPNYVVSHDQVYYVTGEAQVSAEEAAAHPDQYVVVHGGGHGSSHGAHQEKVYALKAGASVIDFSLTKTGLQILIVAIVMLLVFTAVARGYKKNNGMAPKGIQSFFEPIILFVRDDVAKPYMHGKHDRYVPYLLTLFFFIWFSNLFGLTPLSSNITGNTTITIMLALLTFILIIFSATKDFWMHILWFPGVPIWMKPLMLVVELMGFVTKPAALAIRLFANIAAGHFMVLSLISLIFILGDFGRSPGGAIGIMPLSVAFSIFIFVVEVLVAAVQAFVFSLLTAVFIGQALESHDHGHDHGHEAEHAHGH